MSDDALRTEYYELLKIVSEFDGRLMIVKGWGVTLSLAALSLGFQQSHYGLFLVAALSGLGFWLIEGTIKRHQMRYYLRMREIEVLQYQRSGEESERAFSSPRIDSSWSSADGLYKGNQPSEYQPMAIQGPRRSYRLAWFFPHVFLPHFVSVVAGLTFFLLAIFKFLGDMKW